MDHRKPLIGLKAVPLPAYTDNEEEEDSGDDFFESNDDDFDAPLTFSTKPHLSPNLNNNLKPLVPPPAPIQQEDKIKSFDDASPRITVILSSLEDYPGKNNLNYSPTFKGDIYFVPEHVASDELSAALNAYAMSKDPNSNFNNFIPSGRCADPHENVLAQIEIVKYYHKQSENPDFSPKFEIKNLDSRVSALIYYIMAKTKTDHQASAFYCIKSLHEYLKSPTVAPVSSLFPDFTIKKIVHKLCNDLVTLFPHHPLLPSVIHKFSGVDSDVPKLLEAIGSEDSDQDSDFSDSFFESIHTVQQRPPLIGLPQMTLFSTTISNVLENCQSTPTNVLTITVNEPPSTFTYHLNDGASQLTPNLFIDWISSLKPATSSPLLSNTNITVPICNSRSKTTDKKNPLLNMGNNEIKIDIKPNMVQGENKMIGSLPTFEVLLNATSNEITEDYLISLYTADWQNIPELISMIPSLEDRPELFHLQLPLLHIVNANSVSAFNRKCIYPKLMELEFNANAKVFQDDDKLLVNVINEMLSQLPMDKLKPIQVQRLSKLRDPPTINTAAPEDMVDMMYLCDIEFLMNGRSPLTLCKSGRQTSLLIQYNAQYRAGVLYSLYSQNIYPPYINFRASFALALNLLDYRPTIAADILFEGIYNLLNAIPQMAKSECVRNALLFFAELLERLDRYYYSSLLLDTFYLTNSNDLRSSNNIAAICQRNHDIVRAAYHYSKSLKGFVKRSCCDEALYVAQILAQIYTDFGMYSIAANLLCHLLRYSFQLSVGLRASSSSIGGKRGSVQPVRFRPTTKEFRPMPEAINTLLTGISLCEILIKLRHFDLARSLLESMKSCTENNMFLKIFEYLKVRLLLKHNDFTDFSSTIKEQYLKPKRGSTGARLSLYAASNFDTSLATIRLIINGCLVRRLFAPALFWSEVYINSQSKLAIKDIGIGFLQRGEALLHARDQLHVAKPPFSLHVNNLSEQMEQVAKYVKNREFMNVREVISEAASSLKAAQICLDKVACARLTTYASLLYADLLLHYFVDETFDGESQVEPLFIAEPQLEVENIGMAPIKLVTFPPITLDSSNVIDDLSNLFRGIDRNTTRDMNPTFIIYSQVLKAKLNFLQHKESTAKNLFDYAYSNMNKYFVCGGQFIPQDLSLTTCKLFQDILNNMCLLLLFFEREFINDHLIIFDWRNDIQSLLVSRLRVSTEDNNEPIDANINVSIPYLKSMSSLKFPDFFSTLSSVGLNTSGPSAAEETITSCLSKIKANIRLFETQKMGEDEMHDNNRSLCRQIEVIADAYKRDHEANIPIDTSYHYVMKTVPMFRSATFVQRIYDSIYVYVPSTGKKRRVQISSGPKSSFTVMSNKGEFLFTSTSGTFSSKFLSVIALFAMCDKKQHHQDYNPTNAAKLCKEAKDALFGDLCDNKLIIWSKEPDDHLFSENKVFGKGLKGALSSIVTSSLPAIFLTSNDLRALPFELMFPNYLVLRSWSFSHIILKPTEKLSAPKLTVCRWKGDADHLMQNAVQRSREVIRCLVEACGGCFPIQPYVKGNERNVCFPFPLFSSNLENQHYVSKYPFCDFIDVEPSDFPNISSALFIFTYSDLCEMPLMLERLVNEYPFSFYMFIPAQFVREAFSIMSSIFERHQRRSIYVKEHPGDLSLSKHSIILNVPFDFVTCVQATLMQHLNCPIALIAPTH